MSRNTGSFGSGELELSATKFDDSRVPSVLGTGFSGGITDESVSRTSEIRSAHTDARGSITAMKVGHHDGHQDLHDVAEHRGERADLHRALVDLMATEPDDRDAGDIADQHHEREHQCHEASDAECSLRQFAVGVAETLYLVRFPVRMLGRHGCP